MAVNLLAISVGNTRTRIGAFVEGQLVDKRSFRNDDPSLLALEAEQAFGGLRNKPDAGVLVGSVRPAVCDPLMATLHEKLGIRPLRVEKDVRIPIGRQLDREALVGDDRLLNAAAAFDVLKQACVVVDAGTAVTVDLIDGQGTFHGGAIAPGAQLMLDSLAQRAAQLPEVEFEAPSHPIGHNTVEAMLCGVFYGLRGLVRELAEVYAEHAGFYPMVVATGGNSPMLFQDYDLVERVVPDLTLLGIAATWRVALEKQADDEPQQDA